MVSTILYSLSMREAALARPAPDETLLLTGDSGPAPHATRGVDLLGNPTTK